MVVLSKIKDFADIRISVAALNYRFPPGGVEVRVGASGVMVLDENCGLS